MTTQFDSESRDQFYEAKIKVATLKGRLNNALKDELTALLQLSKSVPLSEYGKKRLQQLLDKKKKTK